MSKPYAKPFYNSNNWKLCRQAYVAERVMTDGGLCEMCGEQMGEELHHKQEIRLGNIDDASITLDAANLIFLCKDCHFKVHRELIVEGFKKRRVKQIVNDAGYYFDDKGDMKQSKTYIVWGSPASGKTTYVRENKQDGDLVVDLDLIKQAISMCDNKDTPNNLLPIAIGVRDYLYEFIEDGKTDCKNRWVIASLPNRLERKALAERLNAELVYINSTYSDCLARVDADAERRDKVFQKYLVDKWWEELT
ncbi:MAG: HNH endonuclease [Oscillospiraceae bacterium]